jgi:hypothetical protein
MLPSFSASCSDLIDRWENSATLSVGATELDVWSEFQNLSGDVISRAAFGVSNEEGRRIFLLQNEQAERLVQASRTNYIPGFSYVPIFFIASVEIQKYHKYGFISLLCPFCFLKQPLFSLCPFPFLKQMPLSIFIPRAS